MPPSVLNRECSVLLGDCRSIIPRQGTFDFIFADPPFNIGQKYSGYSDKVAVAEYASFFRLWITQCWNALEPRGVLALHGHDDLVHIYLKMSTQIRMTKIAWVNWHYRFGQCSRSNWIDARCHCLIFAKDPRNFTWNSEAVLVDSDRKTKYNDKRIHDTDHGGQRLPGTVWGIPSDGPYWGRVQGNSEERQPDCPNQLPEVYLARLLKAYTNKGDRVLDPFGGSGTTSVVAKQLGRRVVTCDISPRNVEIIEARLEKGTIRKF